MHVSHETELETAARLRDVAAQTHVEILEGEYRFDEFEAGSRSGIAEDALAVVRDGARWSQLVRATAADAPGERYRLWTCHFPDDVDNSGFVGWLASAIKTRTGSGVLVVCGRNTLRGGIFDYWGCPAGAAATVLPCVRRLVGGHTPDDARSLDGLVVRAMTTGPQSVVGPETLMLFSQTGDAVRARYEGGAIVSGVLVGRLTGEQLSFRYVQIDREGRSQSGSSTCHIDRDPSGLVTITERYMSDAGVVGQNVFESVTGVPR